MYDKFILYNIPESLKTGPAQGMFHLQYGENVFSFKCKALVIGLPDGGGGGVGTWADEGEYRDLMGTLQQISALLVGEIWGPRFMMALLSVKMWGLDFWRTERRMGRSFVFTRSMARWQMTRRGY